jgi:multimeric flavodoxin WrbA
MKVLILQGSPRGNGNTAWMAEEFKKAAEAAGHEVTLVNVAKKKIAGCLACEYCHNKGNGACIQKDDMQELYPLMAEAEALILAAPIYYFTICAQIQAPIQRMYCVNAPAKVKKMALLVSSYSPLLLVIFPPPLQRTFPTERIKEEASITLPFLAIHTGNIR